MACDSPQSPSLDPVEHDACLTPSLSPRPSPDASPVYSPVVQDGPPSQWPVSEQEGNSTQRKPASPSAKSPKKMNKSGRTSPYERPPMLPKAQEEVMVYRNQHPLHTGKPGKLYSRHDRVSPILDALNLLNAQRSIQDWKKNDPPLIQPPKKTTGLDAFVDAQTQGNKPASAEQKFKCGGCGNTDTSKLTPSADRDAMVCECGIVCFVTRISQHREKNCTEDEDKTTHAERPHEATTDQFDRPPPTAEEARRTREREVQNVHYSQKKRNEQGIGYAPEKLNRQAAKAAQERQALSVKDQQRERQILAKLEPLFQECHSVDEQVKRYIRIQSYTAWHKACRHVECCNAAARCQLNIKVKSPAILAEAAMHCALQQLQHKQVELDGVSELHIQELNQKFAAYLATSQVSIAQRAVQSQMAVLMSHEAGDVVPSCPLLSGNASPVSKSSAPEVDMDDASDEDDQEKPEMIQLRDSMAQILKLVQPQEVGIEEAALGALSNAQFRVGFDRLRTSQGPLSKLEVPSLAYIMLDAVARQRGTPFASKPTTLKSLGLSRVAVDASVSALEPLLPHVKRNDSFDEDDLFA